MHKRYNFAIACLLTLTGSVYGAEGSAPTSGYEAEADQAQALLAKAVRAYKEQGDPVLAQLSRQGIFTTADTYVYVVSTMGVMLASGGPSSIYIGRDIRPMLDNELKVAFEEALTSPENNVTHSREYYWMNWRDGKRERKHVYFQRVGDKVFAAGYYIPRSTPEEARRLLDDATDALSGDTAATLEKINRLDTFFNRDDLYVFVIDETTATFAAHGADQRLIGISLSTLRSTNGELIGQRILAAMNGRNEGETSYGWRNTLTGAKELKHTLMKRQEHYIVAVGYYSAN
ncbi:Calcium channel protein [Pseudomonas sp. 9AZ]|uniref:cache domain-containing protein n=1 Tax=Pseudomonas sp. 9AZ TaxID=2653168 RepID=UPI0012F34D8B|nr:cache domain-containing protein [Pseudomonas sp. 9AZ]VXD05249.1 Calcium channel protein [Pseudomonas sp. 9AZ]